MPSNEQDHGRADPEGAGSVRASTEEVDDQPTPKTIISVTESAGGKRKRAMSDIARDIDRSSPERKKFIDKFSTFDVRNVGGDYNVSSTAFTRTQDTPFALSLIVEEPAPTDATPDTEQYIIWGEFNFGRFAGYIQSFQIDNLRRSVLFNWRSADDGDGHGVAGEDCLMNLEFKSDLSVFKGWVRGDWIGEKGMKFVGEVDSVFDEGRDWEGKVLEWQEKYFEIDGDH